MAKSLEIEKIIDTWDDFVKELAERPDCRAITLESWDRCKTHGIDPSALEFVNLTDEGLEHKVSENRKLIEAVRPYMESISLNLRALPHVLVLTDRDGWVIEFCMNKTEEFSRLDEIKKGVNLSEKYIGNNGNGTALFKGESVLVYGAEHFCEMYKAFSCFGVPIRNDKKEIIGSLDLTLPTQYSYPEQLILTLDCVSAIENNYNIEPDKEGRQLISFDKLIATTVHDLRNPITVMRGILEFADINVGSTQKEKGYIHKLHEQLNLQSELLNTLLTIHKPEKFCVASVSELIEILINRLKPLCNSRKIALVYDKDKDVKAKIKIHLFMRAVENLIINAVHVLDNTGKIHLRLKKLGDNILISVRDNGPGMPPEIKNHLFKPFVTGNEEGIGLGLYMVYRTITEVHRGKIWFETGEDKGTTFYIEIPQTH